MRDPEPAAASVFTRGKAVRPGGMTEQPLALARRLLARRGRRRRQSPSSFRPSASAPVRAAGSEAVIESAMRSDTPTRVLIVAADRRFRAVASTLLTQRGCRVNVHEGARDVREQ